MAVYWRDIYDINIPAINNERKSFFSILNQLENGTFLHQREMAKVFIEELVEKANYVFEQEEKLFVHNKCPKYLIDMQIFEHQEFIVKLNKLNSGGFKSSIEFITTLKDFIINHIIGSDLECSKYTSSHVNNRFTEFKSYDPILIALVNRKVLVPWTSYLEVGITEIDMQHRSFIGVVNDLVLNYNIYCNASIVSIIEGLLEYADVHFKTEEKYMDEIADNYPGIEAHKKEHEKFTKYLEVKVEQFIVDQNNGNFDDNEKLLKQLIEWFAKHIIGTDKNFAKVYHKSKDK